MKTILYFVTEDWYFMSHRLALAKDALKAGYKVVVATNINKHREEIEQAGIDVYPIHLERRSLSPFSALKTFFELRSIIKKTKPDLIHLIALKPILLGNLACLTRKTNVINAFTGMGSLYSSSSKTARIIRNLFLILYRFMFWVNKAHIIVQNGDDYRLFEHKRTIKLENLHLIKGSGVDIQKFTLTDQPAPTILTVLLVARALKDKGLHEYVEASRLLKERGTKVIFQFAGDADPHNPTSLTETELKEWHDQGLIEWKGHQTDIPALWAHADIAVLPSYREGLPKTLLEAAAAGKPLIATDVPGCREICIHGMNGLLVPPQNAGALAEAIENLSKDQEKRTQMGKASRTLVEEALSMEAVNTATLSLYQQMLTST